MATTKRTLGLTYLAATGALLGCVVIVNSLLTFEQNAIRALGVLSGLLPSASLVSTRYLLTKSRLDDDQIWSIAIWGALGITVLALLNVSVVLYHQFGDPALGWDVSVLASNVAAGGVAGALVGGLWEHRKKTRELSEKNAVLNRVLRHDLRNALGIVSAQAETLEGSVPESEVRRIELIKQKVDEIVELGDTARTLQTALDHDRSAVQPIDAAALVERRCSLVADAYPEAEIEADLPAEAWVYANEPLESVVDNVLHNAVVHNDVPDPEVRVSMSVGSRWVSLEVVDDGPGVPDRELAVLEGEEGQIDHSSGTGLWLVKWLVEHYDGDLSIEPTDAGTVVRIGLPRATRTTDGPLAVLSL